MTGGWGSVLTLNGVCFDNQSTLTTGPLAHSYAKWRKGTSLASIQFLVANVPLYPRICCGPSHTLLHSLQCSAFVVQYSGIHGSISKPHSQ